jgi:hypothetical protein
MELQLENELLLLDLEDHSELPDARGWAALSSSFAAHTGANGRRSVGRLLVEFIEPGAWRLVLLWIGKGAAMNWYLSVFFFHSAMKVPIFSCCDIKHDALFSSSVIFFCWFNLSVRLIWCSHVQGGFMTRSSGSKCFREGNDIYNHSISRLIFLCSYHIQR